MENKKQTAVDWFAERVQSDKIFSFERVLEQAKQMEKEQIISSCRRFADTLGVDEEDFELWYNEKFVN